MIFLTESIQKTADIAAGYIVGQLVIDPQGVFIQQDNGTLIPAIGKVDVKNGDYWQTLTVADYNEETIYGDPGYAGLRARMMPIGGNTYGW